MNGLLSRSISIIQSLPSSPSYPRDLWIFYMSKKSHRPLFMLDTLLYIEFKIKRPVVPN